MKIFNNENGKEVVYIEFDDIEMINLYALNERTSVTDEYSDFLKEPFDYIDENSYFVRFSTPATLEYLKSLEWIIDYKYIRSLSNDQINKLIKAAKEEIEQLKSQVLNTGKRDLELYSKIKLFEHKICTLTRLLQYKNDKLDIEFPIVPDSDNFKFCCPNFPYIAVNGLDQNQILIFRQDGEKISNKELIPDEFIESLFSMIVPTSSNKNKCSLKDGIKKELSSDRRYLIVTYSKKYFIKNDKGSLKSLVKTIFGAK